MRLEASGLSCVRGGRQVFSGLGFAVGAGEALAVVGPNGAGKSSLLRLVAGLVRPAEGRLHLEGGDPEFTIGEQAHYLGHQDALKPSLSVAENLRFWTAFLGGDPGALDLGARGGRPRPAGRPAGELSLGRAAPAALARPADRGEAAALAARRADLRARRRRAGPARRPHARHLAGGGLILAATHGPLGLDGAAELRLGQVGQ